MVWEQTKVPGTAGDGQMVTLNPDLFESSDHYTYRDLQRLCCRLGLGGKGKREDLVERLQSWNRSRCENASR